MCVTNAPIVFMVIKQTKINVLLLFLTVILIVCLCCFLYMEIPSPFKKYNLLQVYNILKYTILRVLYTLCISNRLKTIVLISSVRNSVKLIPVSQRYPDVTLSFFQFSHKHYRYLQELQWDQYSEPRTAPFEVWPKRYQWQTRNFCSLKTMKWIGIYLVF